MACSHKSPPTHPIPIIWSALLLSLLLSLSPYAAESRDGLPAARIVDIVNASSLSDEEIEPLIELLLAKSNANSEWEAVSANT